jgi:apolipoprotein N-acyltransferase
VQRYGQDGEPRNGLALLDGFEGQVRAVIDKHHLVPFGEYLPFPRLFAALGAVLPMICYEAIFPQDVRRVDRPRAILHLTNDAWFGRRAGPQQHLALARLRAAETGLPVLRAANTGVSAAIDARGTVLAALPLGEAGHVDAPLPAALPPTVYARIGDGLAMWSIALIATLLLLVRPNPVVARGDPT